MSSSTSPPSDSPQISVTGSLYPLGPMREVSLQRPDYSWSATRPPPVDLGPWPSDNDTARKYQGPKIDRQEQYDALEEFLDNLARACWTDIEDMSERDRIQRLSIAILSRIKDNTFHLHHVPCIGPVDGTNLGRLWEAGLALGLNPVQLATHERHWMERNGLFHHCALTQAYNIEPGSAGVPCSPCWEMNAGCYFEWCRYGNSCKRNSCPFVHPIMTLVLALAFTQLGIPTEEAREMAEHWGRRHTWDLPLEAYHFNPEEAGMHKNTQLPPRGSARVREDSPPPPRSATPSQEAPTSQRSPPPRGSAEADQADLIGHTGSSDCISQTRHFQTPSFRPFDDNIRTPVILAQERVAGSAQRVRGVPLVQSREQAERENLASFNDLPSSASFGVSGGHLKLRGSGKSWRSRQ